MAETCKQLLLNAIIRWDSTSLSLFAVFSYHHLSLHGKYNLFDQPLPPEAPSDMDLTTA